MVVIPVVVRIAVKEAGPVAVFMNALNTFKPAWIAK